MRGIKRTHTQLHAWTTVISILLASSSLVAQGPQNADPSNPQTIDQQAFNVVLKQNILDPTALVKATGKPLPPNGKWTASKERPAACPQTSDKCVSVLYDVPEDSVSCQWVVQLTGDGSDGTILQQNDNSSQYFLRKLSASQAENLVAEKRQPIYPPMAEAAQVSGAVVFLVIVSTSGTIEKAVPVSGPPMLLPSAADAIKHWTFKPLMAGTQPVRFVTDVTFDFHTTGPGDIQITSKP